MDPIALLLDLPTLVAPTATTSIDPTAIERAEGLVGYALVFLFAAVPVVEVLVVVPIAVAAGLDPALTAAAAFAGNLSTVLAVVVASDRALTIVRRRFGWRSGDDGTADADGEESSRSARIRRAERLWRRYGVPGLAVAAPVSTGAHLAAVLALSLGSSRRRVVAWMAISLLAWTAALAAGSVYGIEQVRALVG